MASAKAINVTDVARRAGVSTATVSRALSAPGRVSPDKRERVMRAVEELRYSPNAAARSLRQATARKILVTVPNIANPFFSKIIRAIEEEAQRHGYAVLLGDTRYTVDGEEQYAAMLTSREADGLIFLGHRLPDAVKPLINRLKERAPVVNGCEFDPDLGVPSAHIDNAGAAAEAMDHLYALGHRRVGILAGPTTGPLCRDRLAGAMRSVRNHGGAAPAVLHGDFSVQWGIDGAAEMLDLAERPTALLCLSDEIAIGAMHALRLRGVRCPDDMSVVGFDDITVAQYLNPPLTTVRQPMEEIGRATVQLLVAILKDDGACLDSLTFAHQLVIRESTAPPRGRLSSGQGLRA
jgi:LacI family repressor for deo operon, udp, cdd, tsx, nupC, and nupG